MIFDQTGIFEPYTQIGKNIDEIEDRVHLPQQEQTNVELYQLKPDLTVTRFDDECQVKFELDSFQPKSVFHQAMFPQACAHSTFYPDGFAQYYKT